MNQFSTRGIFVSFALLFSLVIISFPSNVYGDEISVTSIAFDETSILELTNNSEKEVNTFRVWLGSDFSFTSFKTEQGWSGEKTLAGVIVFTTSESIKPGESVKFGVKTDKETSKISWKALDKNDNQLATGASLATDIPSVVKAPAIDNTPKNTGESMSTESKFRIVPEKPNGGSTIRVTGDNFGASQDFDFYIDSKKLGSFETDNDGHFMTTMKIPENQKADRVTLKVIDTDGKEKTISLRIGEVTTRVPTTTIVPLTIKGVPDVVHRGDYLEISGTGNPTSTIVTEIITPTGNIIYARTAEIDSKGNWSLDESLIVPLDAEFGKYSALITDGRENIVEYWTIESNKVILINPTKQMFERGELIKFNGTALPDIPIDFVLQDSIGNEISSDFFEVDDSGIVEFQYQSSKNIDKKGTWTLIATQGQHIELIYAGYEQTAEIPVHIEFDKLNYKSTDTAIVAISGEASEKLTMIIVTPSGSLETDSIPIQLEANGKLNHELKLDGFGTGIYNAVIKKGNSQSSKLFTVGLQTGSGDITLTTPKLIYLPGEQILLLGEANRDSLFTATLFDPDGKASKSVEFPSDDQGKFTENRLRVPSNAVFGSWIVKVVSGQNFYDIDIEILSILEEGIMVNVVHDREIPGFGTIITIKVDGAVAKSSVGITISDENGNIIDDSIKCNATEKSQCSVPWTITKNLLPGVYTVEVTDYIESAETTFVVD
ncbi:MAG: hypothetical protein V3U87_16045 [Methylococcaceae bacterium]